MNHKIKHSHNSSAADLLMFLHLNLFIMFSMPSMQVLKLQSKWVLQVVLRIFSQSHPYESTLGALQAFLPQGIDHWEMAVLSPALADALRDLQHLAHASSESSDADRMPKLAQVLESLSGKVTCKTLLSYHRPAARVSVTTHYKKMLNEGHQLVVNAKLDQEADEKGKIATALIDKVSKHQGNMSFNEGDVLEFGKVVIMLQDWQPCHCDETVRVGQLDLT